MPLIIIVSNLSVQVLVFCTTAMVTALVAGLLGELNLNVREIHSRKSQSYRTKVSDEFRKSKGLILVTSDVSARGVDYPDVTLVIQVGLLYAEICQCRSKVTAAGIIMKNTNGSVYFATADRIASR